MHVPRQELEERLAEAGREAAATGTGLQDARQAGTMLTRELEAARKQATEAAAALTQQLEAARGQLSEMAAAANSAEAERARLEAALRELQGEAARLREQLAAQAAAATADVARLKAQHWAELLRIATKVWVTSLAPGIVRPCRGCPFLRSGNHLLHAMAQHLLLASLRGSMVSCCEVLLKSSETS